MSDDIILKSKNILTEALLLSDEILKNIEYSEIPLTNIALKTSRLARILNDTKYHQIMKYEAGGYPGGASGVPKEIWSLGKLAGRVFEEKDKEEVKEYMFSESISSLENTIASFQISMSSSHDPDISLASSNPVQYLHSPTGNTNERNAVRRLFNQASNRLASRRTLIYDYVLQKYYELKFSKISEDVFTRKRLKVDSFIGNTIPESVKQFTSVYENLNSENNEDWSNAVHSCRRILQSLADSVYPPCEDKEIEKNGKKVLIKLGNDNYINRLMQFIDNKSSSDKFNNIVGSHLKYIGERLDSIFEAAQKGSHSLITDKDEADRYVIYTYLIVGDILSLS